MFKKSVDVSKCLNKKINKKTILSIFLLFAVFTLFLIFSSPYYIPVELHLQGSGVQPGTKLSVQWDSGNGFNGYEKERFVLGTVNADPENRFQVTISKESDARVICSGIWIDGKRYSLQSEDIQGNVSQHDELLELEDRQSLLQFSVHPLQNIHLEFLTFNFAGKVGVSINDSVQSYDLYTSNDLSKWGRENIKVIDVWPVSPAGEFHVFLTLPRYKIKQLRVMSSGHKSFFLSKVFLSDNTSENSVVPVSKVADNYHYKLGFSSKISECYFHPVRFLQQLIYAGLLSWLSCSLYFWYRRYDNLKDFLFQKGRYWFLLFFAGSFCIYSCWIIAFWPAVLSVDSLKVWRAAQIPGMFLGDHPLMNVVFYNFLSLLWNNVAVVPIAQNLLLSLLIAFVFFHCYRQQVSLLMLAPMYLLIVCSIPIGLYNTLLWKDTIYAFLVVFCGFLLVLLYEKRQKNRMVFSKQQWIFGILLVFSLPLIRYNGALYLILVPFYLLFLSNVRIRKKTVLRLTVTLFMLVIVFVSLPQLKKMAESKMYFVSQGFGYVVKMKQSLSSEFLFRKAEDYIGMFNVNQEYSKWDLFHNFLNDRYDYRFLKRVGWNDVYPYVKKLYIVQSVRKIAMQVYEKTYEKPWVYFTWNPFYLLFLLPLTLINGKWLPRSALFSSFILVQVLTLIVIIQVTNWRYYYFCYMGIYFLLPLIALDIVALNLLNTEKKNAF